MTSTIDVTRTQQVLDIRGTPLLHVCSVHIQSKASVMRRLWDLCEFLLAEASKTQSGLRSQALEHPGPGIRVVPVVSQTHPLMRRTQEVWWYVCWLAAC